MRWPARAVIFDLDGTVIDSMAFQYASHKEIARVVGGMEDFPPHDDEFWIAYNEAYKKGLSGLYGRYGRITPENFDELYPEIERVYNEFLIKFPDRHPVKVGDDDIGDVIRRVWERGQLTEDRDMRLRLAVNTTKEKRNAMEMLKGANLWQYFDTSVTMDDVVRYTANGEAKKLGLENIPKDLKSLRALIPKNVMKSLEKPNGLSTMVTLGRLGVPYDSVIVFEDTPEGVLSCKNVLMPEEPVDLYVVGVLWGYERDPKKLLNAGANTVISTPSEIEEIIEKFGGFS